MAAKGSIMAEAMPRFFNGGTGKTSQPPRSFPTRFVPRTFDYGATIEILRRDVDLAKVPRTRSGLGTPRKSVANAETNLQPRPGIVSCRSPRPPFQRSTIVGALSWPEYPMLRVPEPIGRCQARAWFRH
ncbi:hypothetical protein JQ615_33575 [Bradyrhizobium jicamae]|uniref:Uncharacterized protein n=1 Tax=Bradyrhizobium jicamae TaxID=280332 RepID=A0ABS5FU58_9BRAD|nr:hypothetical protein [Bradyrhizobium jicamae]